MNGTLKKLVHVFMDEYFLMLESYIYIFWPHRVACGILVPRPGIELVPPAGEVQS